MNHAFVREQWVKHAHAWRMCAVTLLRFGCGYARTSRQFMSANGHCRRCCQLTESRPSEIIFATLDSESVLKGTCMYDQTDVTIYCRSCNRRKEGTRCRCGGFYGATLLFLSRAVYSGTWLT